MVRKQSTYKKSYFSYLSSLSGISGAFSSYQVCHSICLGVISFLSLIGITISFLPLLFLQGAALYLWTAALILFSLAILLYIKNKECMSKNLLVFNLGAIIVGIPFDGLSFLRLYFYVVGFFVIVLSLYLMLRNRIWRKITKNEQEA